MLVSAEGLSCAVLAGGLTRFGQTFNEIVSRKQITKISTSVCCASAGATTRSHPSWPNKIPGYTCHTRARLVLVVAPYSHEI